MFPWPGATWVNNEQTKNIGDKGQAFLWEYRISDHSIIVQCGSTFMQGRYSYWSEVIGEGFVSFVLLVLMRGMKWYVTCVIKN